jgi:hypothetical protein
MNHREFTKLSILKRPALAAALFAGAFGMAPAQSAPHVPPAVSLTSPANTAVFNVPASIPLSATASDSDGTVTNVAFYRSTTLLANVSTAPYNFTWSNAPAGFYAFTAVAIDDGGAWATSGVVNVTVTNMLAIQTLRQIKTVFVIALENHDWTQACPDCCPQQLFGNPAAPYINSLTTAGNSNAAQVSYATAYYSVAQGEHPSEPNYVWSEAGTEFGVYTDNDPSTASGNLFSTTNHLCSQLSDAGISWKDYQEDLEYTSAANVSSVGTRPSGTNTYNGSTEYAYEVKHNPMEFFADTQNQNVYPLTQLWTDLTNHAVGRYNWITPDQYNDMHSYLPNGFTYQGVQYFGDQAAIAQGDNFLSMVIPQIMASSAYQDHGVIILWTDESESTDDTNTTLPEIIISPLAKGNAHASSVVLSHSSDLKTMDEIFGLAFQTNAIAASALDIQGTGYNYVNGCSATVNDLSQMFQPRPGAPVLAGHRANRPSGVQGHATANVTAPLIVSRPASLTHNAGRSASFNVDGRMMPGAAGFQLTFSGPAGQTYHVLASDDLTVPESAWTVVSSGAFAGTNVTFTESGAANHPGRFYVIQSP